ncbi:MAG TPA: hypothetical protein VGD78_00835 [Chthoniobacterales bacterium]
MQHFCRSAAATFVLLTVFSPFLGAQEPQSPKVLPSASPTPSTAKESGPTEKKEEFQTAPPVVTEHQIGLPNGKILRYKAVTGYLLLRDHGPEPRLEDESAAGPPAPSTPASEPKEKGQAEVDPAKGKPKAQVFFVAYLADDGSDPATRPVTFAFNGGPGSASVWLHMGAFGPKRVLLSPRGEALPAPAKLVENESTWLDRTDLVFIDPVSTGYSRPAPGENPRQFHGYREDVQNVGDFIRQWITHYDRWTSPKLIAGESYGTTRAAGLSNYLQDRYGLYLNGIVLISTALNFQALDFSAGNDVPYPLFLPTYAATAWYHHRLSPEFQQKPIKDLLAETERFAANDYTLALHQGDALPPADRDRTAAKLAQLTGLEAPELGRKSLRETDEAFVVDLLMAKNRVVGRLDSRYTGIRPNPGQNRPEFDPADEAVNGPFTSGFYQYLRRELKYDTDLPYETGADVSPWLFSVDRYLDVANDLKKAMSKNRYLKVLVCCGYYDLATPYAAAEYVLHGMNLDPAIQGNLRFAFYESGHMLYLEENARRKFKADFEELLNSVQNAPLAPTADPD